MIPVNLNLLKGLNITLNDIKPIINSLNKDIFNVTNIGSSEFNKDIFKISFGNGKIKVLMWTQMHGNESTATKSIFDFITFVNYNNLPVDYNCILHMCTIYVIPILNPDGAALHTRENGLGNDLNRDAIKLKNKESNILLEQINLIKPDFAFNLHDQTAYYNVENTQEVASMSFLAPAYDEKKSINPTRQKAMSLIAGIYSKLKFHLPHNIGRYNDTYCNNCFGDTIQGLDIPTILIECGYIKGDINREQTRKYHNIAILEALYLIATDNLPDYNQYFKIPNNDRLLYDLKLNNVLYNGEITSLGLRYTIKLLDGKLVKVIDDEELVSGVEVEQYYYYETIDAQQKTLDNFKIITI